MQGYGQFCPVALASEILTRRWTPLVIRELLCGSTRFNEIRRGVPRMSPSLLSTRLDELEEAGILRRREGVNGGPSYELTRAGFELRPIVEALGQWGIRWIRGDLTDDDLDADLLMWDLRRRIDPSGAPTGRTVVRFEFDEQPEENRRYWVVVQADGEVDLCSKDPGFSEDLRVATDLATMTGVWRGDLRFAEVLRRRELVIHGPPELRRSLPEWLGFSLFAGVERPAPGETP